MDTDRFDDLARTLAVARSRRALFAPALGGLLAALGLGDAAAKKKGDGKGDGKGNGKGNGNGKGGKGGKGGKASKGKGGGKGNGKDGGEIQCKPCGVCRECYKGKCEPVLSGTNCGTCMICSGGACVPAADDTLCNGNSRCFAGTCTPPPTCKQTFAGCTKIGPDPKCCSGQCVDFFGQKFCNVSQVNQPCFNANDCDASAPNCVGYRCRA